MKIASLGFALALVLTLAACGGGSSHSAAPAQNGVAGSHHSVGTTVSTREIGGLGTVLVNAQGMTLYAFAPDQRQRVTCTGGCASVWHPLALASAKPAGAGTARPSLLGADASPAGGKVVTYGGWPLYTYVGDTSPGQANGQGLNANGGVWHVVSPSGAVIQTMASSSSSGSSGSTTSGGGGGSSWG